MCVRGVDTSASALRSALPGAELCEYLLLWQEHGPQCLITAQSTQIDAAALIDAQERLDSASENAARVLFAAMLHDATTASSSSTSSSSNGGATDLVRALITAGGVGGAPLAAVESPKKKQKKKKKKKLKKMMLTSSSDSGSSGAEWSLLSCRLIAAAVDAVVQQRWNVARIAARAGPSSSMPDESSSSLVSFIVYNII